MRSRACLFVLLAATAAQAQTLDIKPKAHISVIGNTLADRMQHDAWLDAYLAARFPKHDLVLRHMGFAADELTVRLRSASFGSPDSWLTKNKTDIVFAFFGYNESFAGADGLAKFKKDLEAFIKNTLAQKYNGTGPPQIVLFSPIAQEKLDDRNLPDGVENNKRLLLYTKAMAEVAREQKIPFVDLFNISSALYAATERPLTFNGVHMTEDGNQLLAAGIDKALFPKEPPLKVTTERLEKIRQAALDRNFHWFNRYRTVDGYSIYGGRADLKFVGGQTNRVVAQREMEILDVMTANRDEGVWGAAQGVDVKVLDNNLPAFIPVVTNKAGPLPGGKHIFLNAEGAIDKMTVAKGMKVNLFASEKEFPDLVNPVQMSWDPQGRLWVAAWPTYPHWKPTEPMNDKLLIFEDTDGDGKADKMTTFANDLHCPTGFEFYNGGVLVAQAPDLVFLKDTDGDGKADFRRRVLSGLDSADTHHTSNSFVLDPGGALYFQEGTFHHTQVETPWGPPAKCVNAGAFRYEPRTHKFDVYVAFGFANPHGHVFDRWGQDFVVDGTGANPFHGTLFSGQVDFPARHARPPQLYKQKTRPCPGMEIMSSKHFPDDMQGNLLVANVIGFTGILQYKFKDKGSSFEGIETEAILSSTDPNFRPSDLRIGPDGAIYFIDWHNPIVGHMQHNLRDPSRDREHGRIYRVTYEGRPLSKSPKIAGEPIEKLVELLKQPEDRVRYRVRIELGGRDTSEVVAAARKWIDRLDPKDAEYEHHMMEALWQHQYHNVVNEDLLKRMLRSPDFRARAAATKVLCYWRDRVKNPVELLRVQINDGHPRVRLEALRALSFFHSEDALGASLEVLTHTDDEYLRFVFNETLNTLEKRVGAGSKLDRKNIAGSLLAMLDKGKIPAERRPILVETICRHGGPKELKAIWDQAATDTFTPALKRRAWEALAEAATVRRVQPPVSPAAVQKLLTDADPALVPDVIRLASAWKVLEVSETLRNLARDEKKPEARLAAIDTLSVLKDPINTKALRDLAGPGASVPVRFRAAVSLASIDLKEGAGAAARALAVSKEADDPSFVVEAFLNRKSGPEYLAAALEMEKIDADTAKRLLRAMFLAGRNDPPLSGVVSKFAGLDAVVKLPSTAEIKSLGAEALAKGDALRGERVFRRADLGCIKCHSINKAGGNIGPDLGPIGTSSPMDYIVAAILDPSAAVKEEYLTKNVFTTAGTFVTGVVQERNKNLLVLKDATGKLHRIPTLDIETETNGKSLMPEGVTRILTKGELLDLIRFVSELGKPGPFEPSKKTTIQRWKRLKDVPVALVEGVPNRDVLRDTLLRDGIGWETVYALVGGVLPLDESAKPGLPRVQYLQGEINVTQPGKVVFVVECPDPATVWIGEEMFEKAAKIAIDLATGRHRVTLRVDAVAKAPTLRVEVRRPADSKARFEIVHGE